MSTASGRTPNFSWFDLLVLLPISLLLLWPFIGHFLRKWIQFLGETWSP